MSDMRGVTGVSTVIRPAGDDDFRMLRLQHDGAAFVTEWEMGLALEGRVYVATAGTVTTPITFGAGTIDTTEPDFDMSVPASTLVIPLEIRVYMETYGTNAQFECMASVGRLGVLGSTGATTVTPTNLRMDAPFTSTVSIVSNVDASGATYMTGNVTEFWRAGQQFSITKTTASATAAVDDPNLFIWRRSESRVAPVLYSTAGITRLNVFATSQAGSGFITVIYAELPGSALA